jgi:hypothetical protein
MGADVPELEAEPLRRQHTFNILALQQMGQHTTLFDGDTKLSRRLRLRVSTVD